MNFASTSWNTQIKFQIMQRASKNKSSFSGLLLNNIYNEHFEALLVDICECIVVTEHLIQNSSLAIIPNGGRSGFI